ncbi:MAG: tetratricopeptide repeat-containing glycosyltransferase family protein [Acetobacter sp.]|jgi:Tfp pilus assembly protein PilF
MSFHSEHAPDSGEALQLAGKQQEALQAYATALRKSPDDPRTLSNCGGLLCEMGDFSSALQLLRKATDLAPDFADAWSNFGNSLLQSQMFNESVWAYSRCLELNSSHKHALSNIGVALDGMGLHSQALTFHDIAIRLDALNPETRTNRAISLLAAGNYPEGFAEYEWRWKTRTTAWHGMETPLWDGKPFTGKTLLIHTEGGFGDVLQFARFLPQVKTLGGQLILRIRPELRDLLVRMQVADAVLVEEDPIPAHDFQIPILSLPLALKTTLDTLPFPEGYLQASEEKICQWQKILHDDVEKLRVGLVWAGAPHKEIREAEIADRRRSMSLTTLAPLAACSANVSFYSLQLGEPASQLATSPVGLNIIDHTARLHSFDDTAALISCLDLVIAVDTSTAHLAAALGKTVWLLSRYDQCWRWLSHRTDTPWYASLKIYQQTRPLDWSTPVNAIQQDLPHHSAQQIDRGRRPL